MHIRDRHHLLRITKFWSCSPHHPQGRPQLGIRGLLRADSKRSRTLEVIFSRFRASGGVQFPKHVVPGHHGVEEAYDSEDKVAASPNMRRALTRLQKHHREFHPSSADSAAIRKRERLQRNPAPLSLGSEFR